MVKEGAGRDGLHAQFAATPGVPDIVSDDETAAGGYRAFDPHVVVEIAQEVPPEIMDILKVGQRR